MLHCVSSPLALLLEAHASGAHFRICENVGNQSELSNKLLVSVLVRRINVSTGVNVPQLFHLENTRSAAEPAGHAQPELRLPGPLLVGRRELRRKESTSIQQQFNLCRWLLQIFQSEYLEITFKGFSALMEKSLSCAWEPHSKIQFLLNKQA